MNTASKTLETWLDSFLGCLDEFYDDLEDWFYSYKYSPCYDPDFSSHEALLNDGNSSSWTIEERDLIDDLSIYVEKRLPLLKEDCPQDLKDHLTVTVNQNRLRALDLLSFSDGVKPRRKGASHLLTIARLMLIKGSGITDPGLCLPIIRLLESLDFNVQGSAALSIATFADRVNSDVVRNVNLRHLREGGVIAALLPLLASRSTSVQGHVTGAITALTSVPSPDRRHGDETPAGISETDIVQNHLITLGVVPSLLQLLKPPHVEDAVLTNNVVGSLLNLSHCPNGRSSIVLSGGVPVLVNSLRYLLAIFPLGNYSSSSSPPSSGSSKKRSQTKFSVDGVVGSGRRKLKRRGRLTNVVEDLSLFYALATLTNLCESSIYRTMIVGVGRFDVVGHLVDIVDSLSATSDDAVFQACVLLRNLAIESDHRLLLVKCGVVASVESLVDAVLRRCEKDRKPLGGMTDSQGSDLFDEKGFANEEKILTAAFHFLENLSLHSVSRDAIVFEERKLTELLFKVVVSRQFSKDVRRSAVRVLAAVCEDDESRSISLSDVKLQFLVNIQLSVLVLISDEVLDFEMIVLDLLALLLKFLSKIDSSERLEFLSKDENLAVLRAKVEARLINYGGDGSVGDTEEESSSASVEYYTLFLNETAVEVELS